MCVNQFNESPDFNGIPCLSYSWIGYLPCENHSRTSPSMAVEAHFSSGSPKIELSNKRSIVSTEPTENRQKNQIRCALCQTANKSSSKFTRLIHLLITVWCLCGGGGRNNYLTVCFVKLSAGCAKCKPNNRLKKKTQQKILFMIGISRPFRSMLFVRIFFFHWFIDNKKCGLKRSMFYLSFHTNMIQDRLSWECRFFSIK